ncbi:hypothetical protein EDD86DRAFT_177357, partial [Gorgonomyces haynaldii]
RRYYSSPGAKHRHPYPIGYRASKTVFGLEWQMRIEDSEDGPVFHVESGDLNFSGPSPTAPWTDVCVRLKSQVGGTRISGPLYFGFSDFIVMEMIQKL